MEAAAAAQPTSSWAQSPDVIGAINDATEDAALGGEAAAPDPDAGPTLPEQAPEPLVVPDAHPAPDGRRDAMSSTEDLAPSVTGQFHDDEMKAMTVAPLDEEKL